MIKRKIRNIIWGIVLLFAAAGLILSKLEIPGLEILPNISIWQMLLGAAFITTFITSLFDLSYAGMLFSLAFLGIVFNRQLHIESLVPWTLLAVALLGSIGLHLIFGGSKKHNKYAGCNYSNGHNNGGHNHPGEDVQGDYIREKVSFTGSTKYIHSDNFKCADLSCSFGALEVFFDKVLVPSGEAKIYLDSRYSGVEIYVPAEWRIINNMSSFCGAVEFDEAHNGNGPVTVYIEGNNKFGGVEIKRV